MAISALVVPLLCIIFCFTAMPSKPSKHASMRVLRRPAAAGAFVCSKKPGAAISSWTGLRGPLRKPSAAATALASASVGATPGPVPSCNFTKQLFENSRVRVSDFRLLPGASVIHHSIFPTLRWQVDAGTHNLQVDCEAETSGEVPDKQVFFVPEACTWRLCNIGESVYRQILFEIKQPPKHTEAEIRALLDSALYSTDVGTTLLFENHLCRVWDFYLEPGEGDPSTNVHHHVMDYVFVYVAHGRLLGYHHDGRPGAFDSVNDDNDVVWFDIPDSAASNPRYAHGGKNGYDDMPMREYLVELK